MRNLKEKVALVTGGAHGIGAATVRRLAEAGATVVIADVDDEAGHALAAELGKPHRYVRLDVADDEQWKAAIDGVRVDGRGLHILFLNAGVQVRPPGAPALDSAMTWFTPENYRRVSRINADGVAYGVLNGFPLVKESGGGIILTTISTAAVDHYAGDPTYTMTKAGVLAMVRSLAREFEAEGVRICAIGPGSIDTRMYPSDRRVQRTGKNQSVPADPMYLANAVLAIIDRGVSGDIWFARPDDHGFITFRPPSLPKSPATDDADAGRQHVPATIDGSSIEGRSVGDWLSGY